MRKNNRGSGLVGRTLGSRGSSIDSAQSKDENGVSSTGARIKGPDMTLKRQENHHGH